MVRGGICLSLSGTQGFTPSCRGRQGKMKFPSLSQLITGTAAYAEQKIDTITNDVVEGVRRGSSQMAGAYVKTFKFFSDPYLDKTEFWLGLGNSVLEQYPILAYLGEKAREIVANTKDGFLEGADWLGNKVYEANIPIVSDLMGGLFDASSMEDSKNATSVVGSIMNGGARSILGTIDGLATIVTDPAGTVEGLVKMARDPDIYATQIWNSANIYVDEKLINGSAEDRAKVAGGLIVEVITTAFTFGTGKAANVSKVGKMADAVDTVGDVTLDAARVTGGLWDDIGDAGKWVENIDAVPAKTGGSIESVGKGGSGAVKKYTDSQIDDMLKNIKGDGFKNNPLRQVYEKEVSELAKLGDDLLSQGKSTEEVAQILNQARRDLGIKYKDMTPQPLRDYIYEINQQRYGDPLGPTYDALLKKKIFEQIIESSSKYNPNIDVLLSGFEQWLRGQ